MIPAEGRTPHGLLTPTAPNRVWHVDLTTLKTLWMPLAVVAVIDGSSRKIVSAKAYRKTPGSINILAMLRSAFMRCGTPRFVVTDHGGQFQQQFKAGLKKAGVRHVRGKVRCPAMNGKIERWFRTFKGWLRGAVLGLSLPGVQRRLDRYVNWYNHHRSHSALGGRTPQEAWDGVELRPPIAFYARDDVDVSFNVRRRSSGGDLRLPIVDIAVVVRQRKAA